MKAIGILFVFVLMAVTVAAAVVTAQPVNPAAVLQAPEYAMEPVWMVLSGAALLVLASALRRYIP
jgi:hypothetical protein